MKALYQRVILKGKIDLLSVYSNNHHENFSLVTEISFTVDNLLETHQMDFNGLPNILILKSSSTFIQH